MTAPAFTLTVYGLPAPQGSKSHVGGGRMVESSKYVKPWREAVKWSARDWLDHADDWARLDGPLSLSLAFTFARPKGHYRTGRNAHLLRDAAPSRPLGYPDLSKLIRSTEDALTEAGVWADDSRVVDVVASKFYADSHPESLGTPGAVIRIWRLEEPRPKESTA
ncbi:RusA family crossover junction endodeoxyribonuclease [Streptomyces sp. NPDC087659]|uniref:RusA family crossover junction endodeoxyribonuclease n=1 Tax=Streptomyces sp. NPDC087659 TaxID=3365801 RepID=UPI00380DC364